MDLLLDALTLILYFYLYYVQDNDIFAVMNGVPAFSLCLYGFLTPGVGGGLCFGAGLGITLFGIMYVRQEALSTRKILTSIVRGKA